MLESFIDRIDSVVNKPTFKTTKKKCKCGSVDLFHFNSYRAFCSYECNKCKANIYVLKK